MAGTATSGASPIRPAPRTGTMDLMDYARRKCRDVRFNQGDHLMRVVLTPSLMMLVAVGSAAAQNRVYEPEKGSSNVHVLSHVPLGWKLTTADIEIEQELSRPYIYVQ